MIGENLAFGMGEGELTNQHPAWKFLQEILREILWEMLWENLVGNAAGNLVGNAAGNSVGNAAANLVEKYSFLKPILNGYHI